MIGLVGGETDRGRQRVSGRGDILRPMNSDPLPAKPGRSRGRKADRAVKRPGNAGCDRAADIGRCAASRRRRSSTTPRLSSASGLSTRGRARSTRWCNRHVAAGRTSPREACSGNLQPDRTAVGQRGPFEPGRASLGLRGLLASASLAALGQRLARGTEGAGTGL